MLAAKYQLPPELKAQAEQQAAQWQQMQARAAANQGLNTQSQTRSAGTPPRSPSCTPLWKKVVVFAVAAYAFKKLYDWYYQEPTNQSLEGENADDESGMVDENFDTHR